MKRIILLTNIIIIVALCAHAQHTGTIDNPFTPTEALALAENEGADNVYVEGYVTYFSCSGGSLSFNLADSPTATTSLGCIFSNGFGNKAVDNDNFLKIGDKVLACLQLGYMGAWGTAGSGYIHSVTRDGMVATGEGTPDNPYNPQGALEKALLGGATSVYTKGKISQIIEISTENYFNATYYISDDGSAAGSLYVFRGKYLNGKDFTSSNQIKIGDEVVICGDLINYQGTTPEYTTNNYIVSINGVGNQPIDPTSDNIRELVIKDGDGEYQSYTVERISEITISEQDSKALMTITHSNGKVTNVDADNISFMSVNPKEAPAEAVDLGLSVRWASCNVGANAPGKTGSYFSWGETKSKTYFPTPDYAICYMSEDDLRDKGYIDGNKRITPKFDYATCNIGRDWRMPTQAEAQELINQCTWTEASRDGNQGFLVTGPNGNSIFLPFTGAFEFYNHLVPSSGQYWLAEYYNTNGVMPVCRSMKFTYGDWSNQYKHSIVTSTEYAFYGFVVRPVYDPGYGDGWELSEGSSTNDGFNENDFTSQYVQAQYIISDTQDGTSHGTTYVEVKKAGNSYRVSAYGYEKPCQYGYNDIVVGDFYYTYYNAYNRPVIGRTSYRVIFTVNF